MSAKRKTNFDVLVVGGGIAGLQAALDLADQDYQVAVVEKDATIGGKMIRLSKVFPTLDCASCITTPKMAAAAHHENITLFTYCDMGSLDRTGQTITATITQRPRYVDADKCIGCRQCEYNCPVYVSDEEQGGFSATKAIAIPFSNAIPQTAVLNVENCMLCGKCEKVCPTQAVDYFQQARTILAYCQHSNFDDRFLHDPARRKTSIRHGTHSQRDRCPSNGTAACPPWPV